MPRTSQRKPETFTIHTSTELADALRQYAAASETSVGAVVRQAVKDYLSKQQA